MPRKSADSGKVTKKADKKKNVPAAKKKTARSAIALNKKGSSLTKTGIPGAKKVSSGKFIATGNKPKTKIKSAKLAKPEETTKRSTARPDLPDSYGTPKVVLMPVDSYLMHIYWEVAEKDLENTYRRLRGKYKELQPTLRFFDVTGIDFDEKNSDANIMDHFDVPIDLQPGNWYIHLRNAGRKYFAELGIKTEGGIFSPLIRSNQAETPADMPRPREPERVIFVSKSDATRTQVPLPIEMQRGHHVSASFSPKAAKALRIINREMQSEIHELPEFPQFQPEGPSAILHSIEGRTHINENIDIEIEKKFTPGISSGMVRLSTISAKSKSKK